MTAPPAGHRLDYIFSAMATTWVPLSGVCGEHQIVSIPEGLCVDSFDGGPRHLHETACLLSQDGRPFVRPRLFVWRCCARLLCTVSERRRGKNVCFRARSSATVVQHRLHIMYAHYIS